MKPPAVKKNTRGRPSLKNQKKHAPPKSKDMRTCSQSARFFGIDLNVEPERHSSYTNYQTNYDRDPIPDLNEEPARHSLFVDLNEEPTNFFDYIPKIFRPHIIDFYDVRGDGNCGFRSVALGLGLSEDQWPQVRLDLVRELMAHRERYRYVFGSLEFDNIYKTVKTVGAWMIMPNTGLVIASAYNRVVILLANGGSVGASAICFPLWSSPPQSQPRENIVIAHVNGNHYIRVTLREGCPLPLTHPLWVSYRSDVASRWEYPYLSRQDEFREYHYRAPQAYDIS
ncbi:putative ribonuclease H-like domain-containing protein [Tanacetum coccineum]